MQDLLAGLTATLVMFLPRYGAFLAAGALLRWLIRKEQKPWYLTVALLALGIVTGPLNTVITGITAGL